MKKQKFDFGGWATKNDLLCADGRTIRKNAFKDDDGRTVPLVWQHNHEDPTRVIGHALLENRDEGVYAYGTFNDTDIAQHVKELVRHNDVCSLSIYANKLKQSGSDVLHGVIREVSVVLAGANPGAMIEFPIMEHGEESETEAVIWTGDENLEYGDGMNLRHEDSANASDSNDSNDSKEAKESKEDAGKEPKNEKPEKKPEDKNDDGDDDDDDDDIDEDATVGDVLETMTEKQRAVTEQLVDMALDGVEPKDLKHADDDENEDTEDGETVGDVLNSMTPAQKKVVEFLVAQAIAAREETDDEEEEDVSHSNEYNEEETTMKENVFDRTNDKEVREGGTLTHAQLMTLQEEMKKGTLKEAVLAHSVEYGIENIDYLMPEYREYNGNGAPQFIKRDTTWVNKVMQGVHHTPFAKVKMTYADITEAQARAKGYIKGTRKKEEVFKLLKREVNPKTVYKKQKIDRDDSIDLSNGFDMVAWLKSEMRLMLDEELARAFIIGDGRADDHDDKIDEDKIVPVFKDASLFVIRQPLVVAEGQARADALLDAVTYAWETYQGTGNCVAFMTRREHSNLKLLKDKMGRRIYNNDSEIASALGVREIVFLPQMADETTVRTDTTSGDTFKPLVIILDLDDYNVGADKGGSINMFDDFDIDYNQMKYLIETRCSGALTKPFSAIVIEEEVNPQ